MPAWAPAAPVGVGTKVASVSVSVGDGDGVRARALARRTCRLTSISSDPRSMRAFITATVDATADIHPLPSRKRRFAVISSDLRPMPASCRACLAFLMIASG